MLPSWLLFPLLLPAPVCRLLSVPLTRDPTLTYFVATALPDTAQATAGTGPMAYGQAFMSASTPPGLRPGPRPETSVFGQVVTLDRVGGLGAEIIQRYTRTGEPKAVLIPWGYQADCSPVLWEASARWIEPGAVGFFTAQLRPEREWVSGYPTFDVGAAWHQPYPYGEFLKYDRERTHPDQPELTVAELWSLYEVLPTPDSLEANPVQAVEPAKRWAQSHPSEARRWPATKILELLDFLGRPENR